MTGWQWRGGGRGVWIPHKMMTSFIWTATNQPFQSNKMVQQIKDLPCIRFIITVDHYCFVCLFGALVFVFRILANLCGFFVCWMKFPSDLAMISSLSVINIWVWPALSLRGRPRGAGPLPGTLKVRLAKEGGLTFITPPHFVLLLPTVPAAKFCICDYIVKGLQLSDLFMLIVIAITVFFMAGSCRFSACCLKLSALYASKASENFFATSS